MFKRFLHKIVGLLSALRSRIDDDSKFIFGISVCMGILCGIAAAILKGGIGAVMHVIFTKFNVHAGNWEFLLLPIVGLLISVLLTKYVARKPMDHATARIATDLATNQPHLSPRLIFMPVICSSFTLGMGGSAGAESPIAYTGAAIGSNVGRVLKMSADDVLLLLGCGAAAGIGGIYMAPIGGVMYAFEVLKMKQSLTSALAMIAASLASALTCYVLLGCHTDVSFVPEMRFDTSLIIYVLACGMFCGIYSVYYRATLKQCHRLFGKIGNIWLKALSGGLVLAALLFLFPSLYGEGYDVLGRLMIDDQTTIVAYSPLYRFSKHFLLLMGLFGVLLLVKPIATAATNDTGGVGGDFTPTFFCGGVAGFMFAALLNHYLHFDLPLALFTFFGMAAVMSGSQKAPLMAIFIAAEMTGMYGFILPLTLCALASFLTTITLDASIFKFMKKRLDRDPKPTQT